MAWVAACRVDLAASQALVLVQVVLAATRARLLRRSTKRIVTGCVLATKIPLRFDAVAACMARRSGRLHVFFAMML